MGKSKIKEMIERMDPEEAIQTIGDVVKTLFPHLDKDARLKFVMDLIGESGDEKVTSLVHL